MCACGTALLLLQLTHTYAHTCMHACTHTCMHTYTHMSCTFSSLPAPFQSKSVAPRLSLSSAAPPPPPQSFVTRLNRSASLVAVPPTRHAAGTRALTPTAALTPALSPSPTPGLLLAGSRYSSDEAVDGGQQQRQQSQEEQEQGKGEHEEVGSFKVRSDPRWIHVRARIHTRTHTHTHAHTRTHARTHTHNHRSCSKHTANSCFC